MSAASPFSLRTVLALVIGGTALFVALLWMIGAGLTGGPTNDGGAHGGSKGLAGYAALADLLGRQDWQVRMAQSPAMLDDPGLLVLTPPQGASGKELTQIVAARRRIGPTLIVTPKWIAAPLGEQAPGGQRGWVSIINVAPPEWKGFHDELAVDMARLPGGGWRANGAAGRLPDERFVLSGKGDGLVPLVAGSDGRVLAGYLADGGSYLGLDALALEGSTAEAQDRGVFPVVFVFEPDLIDNWAMARPEPALYALRLFAAAGTGAPRSVTFDLTLNGFKRSANLLTLAFTPPFLAATLCLLLAAVGLGWRGFMRFGPARAGGPAMAFGKRQLVANAGGIVRRSGRLHLLAAPYAALVRERLARGLALPREADAAATEAAIDRVLAARAPGDPPFSRLAEALRTARRPAELLRAAQALHALERKLAR